MTKLRFLLPLCFAAIAIAIAPPPAHAQRTWERMGGIPAGIPPEMEHIGVKEHLNGALPLDTRFRDHTGKPVVLGQYWSGDKPVILTFAYHSCPVLCSMVLNALVHGLNGVGWTVGRDYEVVTISVDASESLEKTAAKRAQFLADYKRAGANEGLHYLVGDKENIDRVAAATGVEYTYDSDQKQYGHPPVVMITKPDGSVARYLYGLEYPPNDLKIGLLEASAGRSISTVEQLILYCYHYDPKGGKYVLVATRVMRVGGAATALLLFSTLTLFWMRERRRGGLIAPPEEGVSTQADQVI